ncbi:hypothetical protein BS47DRAFT_1295574 [Hydnum rufescens UP504]|uniref:Uncharacterized protein n=1 Tax=Hydnum rufescens UP504 TaxID=1448309 RepID=A0A9P6AY95_9AGAM|nr:hypothetical protein BS47DRAFT_1295574 [Hydnum rufescens UP504]
MPLQKVLSCSLLWKTGAPQAQQAGGFCESNINAGGSYSKDLCMFLLKFHCELNPIEMYWGYAKYYCEIFKTSFADAKAVAQSHLDACPLDTIWCFIN